MSTQQRHKNLPRSVRFGFLMAVIGILSTAGVVWLQARQEYATSVDDLDRRAGLVLYRVAPAARLALSVADNTAPEVLGDRLEGHSRLLGLALYRENGDRIAGGRGTEDLHGVFTRLIQQTSAANDPPGSIVRGPGGTIHVMALPLGRPSEPSSAGAEAARAGYLVIAHDALYLDERITSAALRGTALALGVGLVIFAATSLVAWLLFERPMHNLAVWMRRLRFGSEPELPPKGLPVRTLEDESAHLAASFRAARTNERASADEFSRADKTWSRERLRAHALSALGGQPLVVVSNREPYMHQFKDGKPTLVRPASGLVTGLDPVLRACGGLWVAHGAGDADRQTADNASCIAVPPEDPRYTLRRVWITKQEEEGYYYGFSNEGLWPLCHLTHERPSFRAADWEQYVRANRRFADAVLEEVGSESAIVMVQDYQLALVPAMIKEHRPDLKVGLFWHIPWPNPEAFRICPFRVEILQGMLGADLLGFHLQQHCNNFLDTVDRMVEARLDWDHFAAELRGHTTLVRPFPISVQPWSERDVPTGDALQRRCEDIRDRLNLRNVQIGVGVDRIDYTKGIAERFRAIERFFEKHPQHRGRFTFVQLGAPSRTHIPRYRDLVTDLEALADAINWRFKADNQGWKPIEFLVDHHDGDTVHAFLSMASVCIVSSLHDGMNLVAKEFVSAQAESGLPVTAERPPGVLVLSEFAGAARDLTDALIVNPYDTEQFASLIHAAVEMPTAEREQRLAAMRTQVAENNIYRWAADFLTTLAQSRSASPEVVGAATGDTKRP